MIVSLIVAISKNRVIGKDNDLIWHLPNDTKFFKQTTQGHHVIMGRKNFESIPHKFRPLPNRVNIIITRKDDYIAKDCLVVNSIDQALDIARQNGDDEPFIIGGGEIYKLALQLGVVDRIYLTEIHHLFNGDTFFPELGCNWKEKSKIDYEKDDRHKYNYSISVLER